MAKSHFNKTNPDIPRVIEGAEDLDLLCPVNKATGHRENVMTMLSKLTVPTSVKDKILGLLTELPTNNSPASLSDEQRLELLAPVQGSATLSELDSYSSEIAQFLDSLSPAEKADVQPAVENGNIEFSKDDVQSVNEAV